MSEPLQTPIAPEAVGGAAPVAPVQSSPVPPTPSPAPVPSTPAGGSTLSGMPPLSSQPPEVQALVNRGMSSMPGTAPASPTAAQVPVVPQAAPAPINHVQWLAQAGVPIQPDTSQEAAAAAIQQLAQQAHEWQVFQQQHLPVYQQLRQQQFAQQPPAPPAQPQAEPDYWAKNWPQLDPQVQTALERGAIVRDDATGLYTAAPQFAAVIPPQFVHQANQWDIETREAKKAYAQNPLKYTWDKFQPQLEQYVQKRLETYLGQRESQSVEVSAVNQFEKQNASWMFVPGQRDPVTGNPALTPEGQFVFNEAQKMRQQYGLPAHEALARATDALELQILRQQARQPQQASLPPVAPPAPALPAPPAPQPFLVNAAKQQQALHNPSHVPQPPVVAAPPKMPSWASAEDEMKRIGRQIVSQLSPV